MILEMKGICKDFPQGKSCVHVLKNIDFFAEQGDYIAIMGPSGSGKTTLMNIIGCLDVATSGSYFLAEEDISQKTDDELAEVRNRKIGFVFQTFNLLPKLNALDNVALPLLYAGMPKRQRYERAKAALEVVGLEDRMDFRPNQLSGGQSQRVAIARAIAGEPTLLLADEPTGALDTASGDQVMEIFSRLHAAGSTIIMITHEQTVADRAKTIWRLRDGQFVHSEGAQTDA